MNRASVSGMVLAMLLATWCGAAEDAVFKDQPAVSGSGNKLNVTFAVAGSTDVEVAIMDGQGKVVRHLAAGVLGGEKDPPLPLKAGLQQALAWDGKNDAGQPVAGAVKVRVRAGQGVKFGRIVGEDPYTFGQIMSMATDEDGQLHAVAFAGDCNQYAPTLRRFTADGRYLRTLIPFGADLKPEAVTNLATWSESRKSFVPTNFSNGNPVTYPFRESFNIVSASKKAGIVMTAGTSVFRMDSDGGNFNGPFPMWGAAAKLKNAKWNVPQLAVSPDGRYIYYSNVAGTQYQPKKFSDTDPNWPQGRVYRQDTSEPGSDPKPFYDLELPDWEAQKYWLPDAWNKRTAAYGITTDGKGNLYVCDLVNQLIVEVGTDGKKVSASPVPWPERVHVNDATGDMYVICRLDKPKDGHVGKKLVKVSGRGAAAKIVAEMPLQGAVGSATAVGRMSGKAVLWLGGGKTLLCVEDKGTAFETVETGYKPKPDAQLDWSRIAVDFDRDEVYVNNGTSLLSRFDGKTGEGGLLKKGNAPFYCVDMAVGYDGRLYLRTGNSFSGPLERYNHDLSPAPYEATGTHLLYDIYSRMGIGFCDKGLGAGPKGECYISYMYGWNKYFVVGFSGDGKIIKGQYLQGKIGKPDPKSARAKLSEDQWMTSAVVGPIPMSSGGVAVDLAGDIYVGMLLRPKGFVAPEGFEKNPAYASWTGSVVKFPPTGGTVLGAVKEDDQTNAVGTRLECDRGMTVVGGLAVYPGIAPFSGGGWGGNSSCCVCRVPRFGLDRYGRLALPNCVTCAVVLMDNSGNRILEFGGYGNFDSQYVNVNLPSGEAGKPTVEGPEFPMGWVTGVGLSEDHLYYMDTYNKRVIRVDKTWKAEVIRPAS